MVKLTKDGLLQHTPCKSFNLWVAGADNRGRPIIRCAHCKVKASVEELQAVSMVDTYSFGLSPLIISNSSFTVFNF